MYGILANRWCIYHTVIMFDPPVVADIISARLALHKMLYSSPDKSVYCPPGLADSESSDGDIIHSS